MNIFRPQRPYVFYPPRYAPWFQPVVKVLSETGYLKRQYKTKDIRIEGGEALAELVRQGHSVMIAPNHADHADPHVLRYATRRLGMVVHFMAAREGFERSRLSAFILQRTGAFSVNREGADMSAVRTAIQLLVDGCYPLVIFPEGEIWHHHEVLDELNPGTATILLRSARKRGNGKKTYLVPTCLRYFHAPEVEGTFNERMSELERSLNWKPRPELPIVERIYRYGSGMLAAKEVEFLGAPQEGTLVERVKTFQVKLVDQLEEKLELPHTEKHIPDRVRDLRAHIRNLLVDEKPAPESERGKSLYDDLDTLFFVVQQYSYPMEYLKTKPTRHRIAETLLKLEEDFLDKGRYPTPRSALLTFDEPVEVNGYLRENKLDYRSGSAPLTALLSRRIQHLLDRDAAIRVPYA